MCYTEMVMKDKPIVPKDKTGKDLVVDGFYKIPICRRAGIFKLITIGDEFSSVLKVVSARGVPVMNARIRRLPNQYMIATDDPKIVISDPTGYWTDKQNRRDNYWKTWGKRMIVCGACSGSGYYDNMMRRRGKSYQPKCGMCTGTGKVRET